MDIGYRWVSVIYSHIIFPANKQEFPLPERTQRLIDLSDEIAALNIRIMERSMSGRDDDIADRERLAVLMKELDEWSPAPSPVNHLFKITKRPANG